MSFFFVSLFPGSIIFSCFGFFGFGFHTLSLIAMVVEMGMNEYVSVVHLHFIWNIVVGNSGIFSILLTDVIFYY